MTEDCGEIEFLSQSCQIDCEDNLGHQFRNCEGRKEGEGGGGGEGEKKWFKNYRFLKFH